MCFLALLSAIENKGKNGQVLYMTIKNFCVMWQSTKQSGKSNWEMTVASHVMEIWLMSLPYMSNFLKIIE